MNHKQDDFPVAYEYQNRILSIPMFPELKNEEIQKIINVLNEFDNPKILILYVDFPPINSIGAERPHSWYKYFHEYGLNPIVITKNWISDGNTPFNKIDKFKSKETTKYGTLIRVKNVTLDLV